MSLARIAAAIGAELANPAVGRLSIGRVVTDSRQVAAGDLFWSLPGRRCDGQQFVPAALAAGAVAAVVAPSYAGTGPLLRVADRLQALGRWASCYRRSLPVTVVAVTGSVGKTSTRQAIWQVLRQRWRGVQSPQNYNNEVGVPLSLLGIGPADQFAVVELASSGPGEIGRLARLAEPELGVLTAVAPAHLAGLGSLERVGAEKAALLAALPESGTAVLNGDDRRLRAMARRARCRVCWYGTDRRLGRLDMRAWDLAVCGPATTFRFGRGRRVSLAGAGRHQVLAALAAAAVGRCMGLDDEQIAAGLAGYRPPPMRCQVERVGPATVINDAYNANPASMQAGLQVLVDWPGPGRRILVCGDMLELGTASGRLHRQLGRRVAAAGIDLCLATGPMARTVVAAARSAGMSAGRAKCAETAEELAAELAGYIASGDVVLVKASRGLRLERVVEKLRERLEPRGTNAA